MIITICYYPFNNRLMHQEKLSLCIHWENPLKHKNTEKIKKQGFQDSSPSEYHPSLEKKVIAIHNTDTDTDQYW